MKIMKVLELVVIKLSRMMTGEGITGVTVEDSKLN